MLRELEAKFDYAWNLGVISDQVDFDLNRVLRDFCPKYELRWVEIREVLLDGTRKYVYEAATPRQLKELRKQMDDAGVRLSVLDTAVFKVSLPGTTPVDERPAYLPAGKDDPGRQKEDLKRACEAARALGGDRIRLFTFRRVAKPETVFERVVEQLNHALEIAKEHEVTLLVENEYDTNIGTGSEIVRLFQAIPNRRLMHNWDPCNAYELGERPYPDTWNLLDHTRISHVHLKDARGKEWRPIGSGELNFSGQFQALKKMSYTGTLSVETRYRNGRMDAYASTVESMTGLLKVLKSV